MENIQEMFMKLSRLCLAQMNLRVSHRRVAQMSVSLSFEVKDFDISRTYFQQTIEKFTHF